MPTLFCSLRTKIFIIVFFLFATTVTSSLSACDLFVDQGVWKSEFEKPNLNASVTNDTFNSTMDFEGKIPDSRGRTARYEFSWKGKFKRSDGQIIGIENEQFIFHERYKYGSNISGSRTSARSYFEMYYKTMKESYERFSPEEIKKIRGGILKSLPKKWTMENVSNKPVIKIFNEYFNEQLNLGLTIPPDEEELHTDISNALRSTATGEIPGFDRENLTLTLNRENAGAVLDELNSTDQSTVLTTSRTVNLINSKLGVSTFNPSLSEIKLTFNDDDFDGFDIDLTYVNNDP